MTEPLRCAWCGKPAGYLCDFPTGDDWRKAETCDAPMCEDHRTLAGSGMLCRRPGGCQPVTIDYCPDHAGDTA